MSIIKWRPLADLEDLSEVLQESSWIPSSDCAVDVYQDKENVYLEMHVAGIAPDHIDVEAGENHLHITASREEHEERDNKHFHRREIRYGSFERIVALPCAVNPDTATASVNDGVLRVKVAKQISKSPTKVKVKPS